jgi:hypothetical protein
MTEAIHSYETSFVTRATHPHIPEDGIRHSRCRDNLKSYAELTGWNLQRRCKVYPVRYELSFISQKTKFLLATAMKISNLTLH